MASVTDNITHHRFEMVVDGQTAFLDYAFEDGRLVLIHTEVPQALEGHGIGATNQEPTDRTPVRIRSGVSSSSSRVLRPSCASSGTAMTHLNRLDLAGF